MSLDIVTGGSGFIGSHLVDALVAAGRHVRVIDNNKTNTLLNLAHARKHSRKSDRLEIWHVDINNYGKLEPLFQGAERVFHLAALADIVPSIENPQQYYSTNVSGTLNVCQAAVKAGVRRLVYTASSSCYGIPDHYPTAESSPNRPQYPYALTKLLGEQLVMHWAQVYGLPALSLRLFNVYGPRARTNGAYGAVFGVFLAQLLNRQPLTVVGDGKQTRDFTYVSDVVSALIRAAESTRSGIYNVGSGCPISVNKLVELLGAPKIVHIPKRPGEPECTHADITAFCRDFDWRPQVTIEQGVGQMLANINYWRNAPVWTPQSIEKATQLWFERLGAAS